MRVITITVGHTYNTGNYTSRKFEATAELDHDEDFAYAMQALADDLDNNAEAVMRGPVAKAAGKIDDGSPF